MNGVSGDLSLEANHSLLISHSLYLEQFLVMSFNLKFVINMIDATIGLSVGVVG